MIAEALITLVYADTNSQALASVSHLGVSVLWPVQILPKADSHFLKE